VLVEIPSDSDANDNIVAFWSPRDGIPEGGPYSFAYRLFWGGEPEAQLAGVRVGFTRSGQAREGRIFVIDYLLSPETTVQSLGEARAEVTASRGEIGNVVLQQNPATAGWRLSFTLDPSDEQIVELRANVTFANGP